MSSRRRLLLLAAIVAVPVLAFLAFGVFGVQTLFFDEVVDEAAPTFAADVTVADDETETDTSAASDTATDTDTDEAAPAADTTTEEPPAEVEPLELAIGSFVDGDHPTSGTAVVLGDGGTQRVLRLDEDFVSDNGPDLNVYLASSAEVDGDYVDLGDLKGNIGGQNYEIPADIDLAIYDTVVIWCVRFGVGFGSAELMSA